MISHPKRQLEVFNKGHVDQCFQCFPKVAEGPSPNEFQALNKNGNSFGYILIGTKQILVFDTFLDIHNRCSMLQLQDDERNVILEIVHESKGHAIDSLINLNEKLFTLFSGEDVVGTITYDPAKGGYAAEFPADLGPVIKP